MALFRHIRTIIWVLRMSMPVTSCSDFCWTTYLPSRSPLTCPVWNLRAPCLQPGQSLAPHAACWREWPHQPHSHSRPKPKGHPPYYPLLYLASHQSKSHQFCFTNSSLLPLSLPNPDQIHRRFPGHLKQPFNLSFSLPCLFVPPPGLLYILALSDLLKMNSGPRCHPSSPIDRRPRTRQTEACCASHCD